MSSLSFVINGEPKRLMGNMKIQDILYSRVTWKLYIRRGELHENGVQLVHTSYELFLRDE